MFVFWGSVLRPSWSLLSSILPCKCLSYCLSDTNIILCHLSASSQPPPWKWHLLIPNVTQYKNQELPSVQTGFRKGWGSIDHIAIIRGSQKKQQDSRKTSTSASLTTIKLLTGWITINCGTVLKRWEYQGTLPASWEICVQVKRQQLQLNNWLVPNWERSLSRLCIVTLLI